MLHTDAQLQRSCLQCNLELTRSSRSNLVREVLVLCFELVKGETNREHETNSDLTETEHVLTSEGVANNHHGIFLPWKPMVVCTIFTMIYWLDAVLQLDMKPVNDL